MFKQPKTPLQKRMDKIYARLESDEQLRLQREQELSKVQISKADVEQLMRKMGLSDTDKASRLLRQAGGHLSDAIKFCVFDFSELKNRLN